jgi:hypothetical protein
MSRVLLSLCLFALLPASAPAQAAKPLEPRQLTLSPAKLPRPALKYRLLPDLMEQTPGKALDHYLKAAAIYKDKIDSATEETLHNWLELPADLLPKDDARKLLKQLEAAVAETEAGALCEETGWPHGSELRKKGIGALLTGIQELRQLIVLMRLKARLAMADGKPDRAVRSIRLGLAMSRHAAESPTLISMLVGAALAQIMVGEMEELLAQPGAPNLAWALGDLPRPYLDMHKAFEGERLGAYSTFPGLTKALLDPDAGPISREELSQYGKIANGLEDNAFGYLNRYRFGLAIQAKHERAKQALIDYGRPRERVEALPPLQVAFLHSFLEYDQMLDEFVKWQSMPYWEAYPHMKEAERQVRLNRARYFDFANDRAALPIADLLLPAFQKVLMARARIDRRFAALRVIEAVRAHAAVNGGKLPAILAEIKVVPVPDDPVTGKPFQYERKGDTAKLSAPPFPDQPERKDTVIRYELTLRK